jgi:hemoglobin/transferrin/lactoferrin receptor protein
MVSASEVSRALEETVATASRTRQRVLDSASSISTITEQNLARSTGYTLAQLLRDIPSVQVTDSDQPGLGRIRIRGEESMRYSILRDQHGQLSYTSPLCYDFRRK